MIRELMRLLRAKADARYEPSKHYMRGPGPKATALRSFRSDGPAPEQAADTAVRPSRRDGPEGDKGTTTLTSAGDSDVGEGKTRRQ